MQPGVEHGLLELPAAELALPEGGSSRGVPVGLLRDRLALRYVGVLTRAECTEYVAGIYSGQAHWIGNFGDTQFTLGRAWYTDLEQGRSGSYFAQAALSDAIVQRLVPGLQERMLALLSAVVGEAVFRRPGWCGPGVHIFPGGDLVARTGGDVHCDWEGLTDGLLEARVPAVSLVLMLQQARRGGALRVWDLTYDGDEPEEPPEDLASVLVPYGAGDLVVFDSYRLHQIQPFAGREDRVSATVHGAWFPGGAGGIPRWEAWF